MKRCVKRVLPLLLLSCLFLSACGEEKAAPEGTTASGLVNAPGVVVSDAMTYRELAEAYAAQAGLTLQGAEQAMPQVPEAAAYRVFSVCLAVTPDYGPRLDLYCAMTEGEIGAVCQVWLAGEDREDPETVKSFGGDVQVWLREGSQIEYVVNGDFFHDGTTTLAQGLEGPVGVGEQGQVSFAAPEASDNYSYCYAHNAVTYHE